MKKGNTIRKGAMETEVVWLTQELVAIESVNPALVSGGAGETAIAHFVAEWLERRGFAVQLIAAESGRPSVIGRHRGQGGGRSLLLNGHLDTVTLAGYQGNPLAPVVHNGRLHGRGSYDMKSGVAALLVAAATASKQPLRGDIIVACVADEEYASQGTAAVLDHVHADGAIVTEPTELNLVTAHKGFIWATITTHGIAAHGSRPDLGVDAIVKMGAVLRELGVLDGKLRGGNPHPLLGCGSVHGSLISGGAERSSYPAYCTLDIERRTIPGETASTLQSELDAIIAACAAQDPLFQATIALDLERESFQTPQDAAILDVLRSCAGDVLGAAPPMTGVSYWTDAALMQAKGIPTVIFGAAGAGAHAANEYVEITSLHQLTAILTRTISAFCG
jgi:acetylornithine deacetylase